LSGPGVYAFNFKANPIQANFIASRARADLFSSRRGEGKSTALVMSCYHHTLCNPGARWLFIRDTFENLQRTTMATFFQWFPPGVAGTYHATKKEWTWAEGVARGSVLFFGMDDQADASRVLSLELGGIAMDEPAPAVTSGGIEEHVFNLSMTSLRQMGMGWYAVKLAENNPDESHWTYRRFVSPGQEGYVLHQPRKPENEENLPRTYYEDMRRDLAHRPDLIRRFVDGEFGFQSQGSAITPQWSDRLHLATGLYPIPRLPLYMLWDWGHNPTCLVSQITPMGEWNFLDALVGEGIGVSELIENELRPLWNQRYAAGKHELTHIGDPTGSTGSQVSIMETPIAAVRKNFQGTWRPGPVKLDLRIEPARAVLTRVVNGHGLVQVDKHRAKALHWALRGGAHFPVSKQGIVGTQPVKNIHSHPFDAFSYGAAILFPLGRQGAARASGRRPGLPDAPSFFGGKDPLLGGGAGLHFPAGKAT
jgi:hypothetical protein